MNSSPFVLELTVLDWVAAIWFLCCWVGYNHFSRYRSRRRQRLQNALYEYIKDWVRVLQERDLRIVDTQVIANIERNATFMASSSLLIIAALATATSTIGETVAFLSNLPFVASVSPQVLEIKMLSLIVIFAYAFFKFTWCVRQWGFISVLVAAAELPGDMSVSGERRLKHRKALAKLIWLAIYSFNLGMRGYYFSLALLAWFINPFAVFVSTTLVVVILYRREFRSRTLNALLCGREQA